MKFANARWVVLLAAVTFAACDRENEVTPVTTPPPATTTPPATAPAETDPAEGTATTTVDEATRVKFQTLVEQVTAHIRNREFDAAETGLRELEQMRGTVTEPMKQQIATTRAALTAARAAPGGAGGGAAK